MLVYTLAGARKHKSLTSETFLSRLSLDSLFPTSSHSWDDGYTDLRTHENVRVCLNARCSIWCIHTWVLGRRNSRNLLGAFRKPAMTFRMSETSLQRTRSTCALTLLLLTERSMPRRENMWKIKLKLHLYRGACLLAAYSGKSFIDEGPQRPSFVHELLFSFSHVYIHILLLFLSLSPFSLHFITCNWNFSNVSSRK